MPDQPFTSRSNGIDTGLLRGHNSKSHYVCPAPLLASCGFRLGCLVLSSLPFCPFLFLFILVLKRNLLRQIRNGPYVFKRTGSFKDWSIEDRSYKINVPTLLINGKYDGAQDSVMEPFFNSIEKVKWVRFGESSHTPHLEEPEEYLKVVNDFLSLK